MSIIKYTYKSIEFCIFVFCYLPVFGMSLCIYITGICTYLGRSTYTLIRIESSLIWQTLSSPPKALTIAIHQHHKSPVRNNVLMTPLVSNIASATTHSLLIKISHRFAGIIDWSPLHSNSLVHGSADSRFCFNCGKGECCFVKCRANFQRVVAHVSSVVASATPDCRMLKC